MPCAATGRDKKAQAVRPGNGPRTILEAPTGRHMMTMPASEIRCAAPSGLARPPLKHPGLTAWAFVSGPVGAKNPHRADQHENRRPAPALSNPRHAVPSKSWSSTTSMDGSLLSDLCRAEPTRIFFEGVETSTSMLRVIPMRHSANRASEARERVTWQPSRADSWRQ